MTVKTKYSLYDSKHPPVAKSGNNYLKRVGTCNPEKCGSICCRIIACDSNNIDYLSAMLNGKIIKRKDIQYILLDRPCSNLKNGKCVIHRDSTKPIACKQFPIYHDSVWEAVRNVCSYKYIRITKKEYERISKRNKESFEVR